TPAYEQGSYKQIQAVDGTRNYYYCFKWLGSVAPTVEDCFRIIDNNKVDLEYFGNGHGDGYEGQASGGVLTRAGEPTNSPQSSVMGCEPANGKVQYGIINIGPDVFVIFCGERRLVPNPETLDALGINRNMIDNMGMSDVRVSRNLGNYLLI
ncbi:MAG: hypothetical protein M1282_01290, partial [Chloroflexi bacterium]|nr:hypothetical protein [Chloroflexota bacterium]